MNHEDRDRLRAAFNRAYGTRFARPGLRERVLGETAARQARRHGPRPHWALTAAAVALALLVVATLVVGGRVVRLGGSTPAHRGGPAPAVTAVPSPSPTAPVSPPTSPSATACRVPFVERTATGTTAHWLNADGTVTDDPSGTFTPRPDNFYVSAAAPALTGPYAAYYYDSARGRWLPVDRSAVSTDGAEYAYTAQSTAGTLSTTVHVVDVASGRDRTYSPSTYGLQVVDLAPDGLYLVQNFEGPAVGLWRLDLASGQLQPVLGTSNKVVAVSNGVAWVEDTDASAPVGNRGYGGGPQPNRLSRLDLRTGAVTHWITVPDEEPSVIGYASDGSPFVVAWGVPGSQVLLVTSPGHAQTLASYPTVVDPGIAIADGSTEWLSGPDGLYRYDGSGLHRVVATSHPTVPANRCI